MRKRWNETEERRRRRIQTRVFRRSMAVLLLFFLEEKDSRRKPAASNLGTEGKILKGFWFFMSDLETSDILISWDFFVARSHSRVRKVQNI
jgi:hypothetical protein